MFTPYVDELQQRSKSYRLTAYIGAAGILSFFIIGMFASFRQGLFADLFAKPDSLAAGYSCSVLETEPFDIVSRSSAEQKLHAFNSMSQNVELKHQSSLKADHKNRARLAPELVDAADKQKLLALDIMRQDANAGLTAVNKIKKAKLDGLPANCLPKAVTLSGEITVIQADDIEQNFGVTDVQLMSGGKVAHVHIANNSTPLISGMNIKVKGLQMDQDVLVDESDKNNLIVEAKSSTSGLFDTILSWLIKPAHAAIAGSMGDQPTVVVLAGFADAAVNASMGKDGIADVVYNQVNQVVKENSFGKTQLTGDVSDVYGPYTMKINKTCAYSTIVQEAIKAADPSVDFRPYSRLVVIVPLSGCNFSGYSVYGKTTVSTAEGNLSMGWTLNKDYGDAPTLRYVITHELSHSFGVSHGGYYNCGATVFCTTANSTDVEYGDRYTPMGRYRYGAGLLSAKHREYIGWFNAGNLQTVTTSGTFTLEPYETNTNGLKALKIPRGNSGDTIYVEYRQPIGVDSFIVQGSTVGSDVYSGALLHNNSSLGSLYTNLLDPTPSGDSLYPALQPGQSVYDAQNKIMITTVSRTATALTIRIEINGSTPTPTPTPSVTSTPTPTPTLTVTLTPSPTIVPSTTPTLIVSNDTIKPTVSITSPTNGALIARAKSLTLKSSASDNIGIERVDYYVNNRFVCSAISAAYDCDWSVGGKPNASYTIEAWAYDAAGNLGQHQITAKTSK